MGGMAGGDTPRLLPATVSPCPLSSGGLCSSPEGEGRKRGTGRVMPPGQPGTALHLKPASARGLVLTRSSFTCDLTLPLILALRDENWVFNWILDIIAVKLRSISGLRGFMLAFILLVRLCMDYNSPKLIIC